MLRTIRLALLWTLFVFTYVHYARPQYCSFFFRSILSIVPAFSLQAVMALRDSIKRHLKLPHSYVMEYKPHDASLRDNSSYRNTWLRGQRSNCVLAKVPAVEAILHTGAAFTQPGLVSLSHWLRSSDGAGCSWTGFCLLNSMYDSYIATALNSFIWLLGVHSNFVQCVVVFVNKLVRLVAFHLAYGENHGFSFPLYMVDYFCSAFYRDINPLN